jgi:thiol:disulfide interchange protein DsbD
LPRKPPRAEFAALAAGALLLAAFGAAVAAGLPGTQKLLPPEQAFRFSARALDPATVEARFDVADGYYLYRDKLRFTLEPIAGLPAELPRGTRKHDEFFGDVETYRGAVVVRLPLAHAAPGQTLTLHAESQGCADAGICYPLTPQQLKLDVPAAGARPGGYVEAGGKGWFK